jgi:DNA polymerase
MIFKRQLFLECEKCPYQNQTIVYGHGSEKGHIIFLGEAPGKEEDKTGLPFVGDSGNILNRVLRRVNIDRESNWVTNILLCRPPNNKFNYSMEAIHICKEGLKKELEFLRKKEYHIIVALGLNACSYFPEFNKKSMGEIKGNIYEINNYKVIPTYHPSYIVRNLGIKPDYEKDLWKNWEKDFIKVKELIA